MTLRPIEKKINLFWMIEFREIFMSTNDYVVVQNALVINSFS